MPFQDKGVDMKEVRERTLRSKTLYNIIRPSRKHTCQQNLTNTLKLNVSIATSIADAFGHPTGERAVSASSRKEVLKN